MSDVVSIPRVCGPNEWPCLVTRTGYYERTTMESPAATCSLTLMIAFTACSKAVSALCWIAAGGDYVICTREAGHDGDHAAHGPDRSVLMRWAGDGGPYALPDEFPNDGDDADHDYSEEDLVQ